MATSAVSLKRALEALSPNRQIALPIYLGYAVASVAVFAVAWQLAAGVIPAPGEVLGELYDQTLVTRTIVEINGHTDADGDAEANRELSRRRALAVRDYMAQRSAVSFPASRFRVMGFGEDSPIASNNTAANKAKNRRVEIVMRTR